MNRNRTAGHNYERIIIKDLKILGYTSVVTSRAESRNMDNAGVDIFDTKNGEKELPFHVQCKNTTQKVDYPKLLNSELLPKDKPTFIFHKKTKKVNTRFMPEGEYVIMKKEDFYKLIK